MNASANLDSVLINPSGVELGQRNAIVWRRASHYHFDHFPGSLSIKSAVSGCAVWETQGGRFEIDPNSYLVLNTGQDYSMTIEAPRSIETFCLFFRPGFVEAACHAHKTADAQLLDDPFGAATAIGFSERLHQYDDRFRPLLTRLHTAVVTRQEATPDWLEEQFIRLANVLVQLRSDVERELEQLPALRCSTRMELYKRLHQGKHFMDASLSCRLSLAEISRHAYLSPFHFHRLFTQTFSVTPQQYHVRCRLERAASMLIYTDLPITTICLDTGFKSVSSFSSRFRKHFGTSPRDFRQQYAKKSKI